MIFHRFRPEDRKGCIRLKSHAPYDTLSLVGASSPLQVSNEFTEVTEFALSTWDGSDIFNLEDTLIIACTPRVKEALEKAEIGNLELLLL